MKEIRKKILQLSQKAGACHVGSALSCVDIVIALNEMKGKLVFSKASGASAVYVLMGLSAKYLKENPFIYPGGSLGHGLPIACGLAIGNRDEKVYCLMSDAELQEGTTWESLLFASQHKLDNLIIVIDRNYLQALGNTEDILALEPLDKKLVAFGCEIRKVNGHNLEHLRGALTYPILYRGKPIVIIANTIKGKGIPEMENNFEWHYKNLTKKQCENFSSKL